MIFLGLFGYFSLLMIDLPVYGTSKTFTMVPCSRDIAIGLTVLRITSNPLKSPTNIMRFPISCIPCIREKLNRVKTPLPT